MNDETEYRVAFTFVRDFDAVKLTSAELGLLQACLPELAAAWLDATTSDDDEE